MLKKNSSQASYKLKVQNELKSRCFLVLSSGKFTNTTRKTAIQALREKFETLEISAA